VVKSETFKKRIQRLGILVGELESAPDDRSNGPARELVQLLMEVHGTAVERLLEIVFDFGPNGEEILAKAADDAIVRPLLLLYSLHPDDLETRVLKALDAAAPRLRKHNSEVKIVSMREGAIELKFHISGHACGSTSKTLKNAFTRWRPIWFLSGFSVRTMSFPQALYLSIASSSIPYRQRMCLPSEA